MISLDHGTNKDDIFTTSPNTFHHYFCMAGNDRIIVRERFVQWDDRVEPISDRSFIGARHITPRKSASAFIVAGSSEEAIVSPIPTTYFPNDFFFMHGGGNKHFESTIPVDDLKFDDFIIADHPAPFEFKTSYDRDYANLVEFIEDDVWAYHKKTPAQPLNIVVDLTVDSIESLKLLTSGRETLLSADVGWSSPLFPRTDIKGIYLQKGGAFEDPMIRVVGFDPNVLPKNNGNGSVIVTVKAKETPETYKQFVWNTDKQDFDVIQETPPKANLPIITHAGEVTSNALLPLEVIAKQMNTEPQNIARIQLYNASPDTGFWVMNHAKLLQFNAQKHNENELYEVINQTQCVIQKGGTTQFYKKNLQGQWDTNKPLSSDAVIVTPISAGAYTLQVTTTDNKIHSLSFDIQQDHPVYAVRATVHPDQPFHVYDKVLGALNHQPEAQAILNQATQFVWTFGKAIEPGKAGQEAQLIDNNQQPYLFTTESGDKKALQSLVCQNLATNSNNWPVGSDMLLYAYGPTTTKPIASLRIHFHPLGY